MRAARSLFLLFACAAFVLVTSAAGAVQNYNFSGKFTSNRGKIINIPQVGNTPCAPLILMTGPVTVTAPPGTMTPAVHPITRGANTQPPGVVKNTFMGGGMDLQCVKHKAGIQLKTNVMGSGTAMGKGGDFVMPNFAFSKPLPPYVRAVEVKYVPPVEQLATSFKITGPASMRTTPPQGTMCAPTVNVMTAQGMTEPWCGTVMTGVVMTVATNIAPFHGFQKNAFLGQTGRAAANFRWCPFTAPFYSLPNGQGGACTNINQAGPNVTVKYTGGPNAFGGTMSYIITTGPNTSSLALGIVAGPFTNAVAFQKLAGMGSQPTGRGYADFLTDMLAPGPIWGVHTRNKVTPGPIIGQQKLITMVSVPLGSGSKGYNYNWGFPLTTGTVLVRVTGAMTTTLTAKGYDKRATPTAMGNRNLSLVAGGLAVAVLAKAGQLPGTPEILSMKLPEPASTMQMLAGVAALLGVAGWRLRKTR